MLGRVFPERTKLVASALIVAVVLAGCASTARSPGDPSEETSDPFEPVNRVFFDFNMFLDRTVLRPITRVYVDYVPEFIRAPVHNILEILNTPVVMANALAQGNTDRFTQAAARFTVNVVAGIGILDVAGDAAPPVDEDFGQTLAVWGSPSGPYLVLPLLGPSTVRDAIGRGVDSVAEPTPHLLDAYVNSTTSYLYSGSKFGATVIDQRSRILGQLEELEKTSLDFYATVRSLYIQRRRDQINNGETSAPVPIPEISFERDDTGSAETTSQPDIPSGGAETQKSAR